MKTPADRAAIAQACQAIQVLACRIAAEVTRLASEPDWKKARSLTERIDDRAFALRELLP